MKARKLHRRIRPLRRWVRRRKQGLTYWLACFGLWLPRQVSLERALSIADRIGNLAYAVLARPRRLALEHIEIALGASLPRGAREQIVRAAFRNLARSFSELAKIDEIRPRLGEYVAVEGWEHLAQVVAEGRGGIAITGHIGNWELLAAYCASHGVPVGAVARRLSEPRLNRLLVDFRAASGIETVLRESPGATRQILRILNSGGILALLIDQDTRAPSISVPFFGKMARTPAAAAALAVRRDLPIVPIFMHRRAEGGHCLTVLPPIRPAGSGDRRRDVLELTRVCSEILEERIRKNPAEWVWWHRRWRRPPIPRLDLDREIPYSSSNSVLS
jgi:Kdo2-lipid IVA lauroyltransferase/acyltransferase